MLLGNKKNDLMVTIRCITYNHEPYIRQCLEGFVMQKTNFRFEAIVHDDASTDGTAAIIREYAEKFPDIIKPIYEVENQYSKRDGSLARIMNAHMHGKYIAFCEGDDYWIDPLKLQKQVDFLEDHPDFGLVHTSANVYLDEEKRYIGRFIGEDFKTIDDLLITNRIATLTTCFRKTLFDNYNKDIDVDCSWKMGDYPLWIYMAKYSNVYFMNNVTATYRLLTESACHSQIFEKRIDFELSVYSIASFFIDKYKKEYLYKVIRNNLLYTILSIHILFNKKVDLQTLCRELNLKSISFKTRVLYILSKIYIIRRLLQYRWSKYS